MSEIESLIAAHERVRSERYRVEAAYRDRMARRLDDDETGFGPECEAACLRDDLALDVLGKAQPTTLAEADRKARYLADAIERFLDPDLSRWFIRSLITPAPHPDESE